MSIAERRNNEISEMKKKIMNATIEIINLQGYENLSIRKIAAKIDYSPTTIYIYYKDKAQIIFDMADALYNKIIEKVKEIINNNDEVIVQIHNILIEFIIILSHKPEMIKAIFSSGLNAIFVNENNGTHPTNEGLTLLENLLKKGINKKIIIPCAENTSWMIISALLGFVLTIVDSQLYIEKDFVNTANHFVAMIIKGITY